MQLGNSDLLNVILQISTSNRKFMQLLLSHGCINYSQLCSDILKVMHECYDTSLASRKFRSDLNSFVSCYLQFVFCVNKKLNLAVKQHVDVLSIGDFVVAMSREFSQRTCKKVYYSALPPIEEPTFVNYIDRLKMFINHNSLNIDFDHLRLIKNSKPYDVHANVEVTNDENSLMIRNQIIRSKQIFAVDDFQTFLSPLKEDYTKSSKGYICQNKIVVDKNKLTSNIELLDEDDLFNLSDESEIEESSFTGDNYDPVFDDITFRHLGCLKNISSDSESSLNGRVSNSDSEDSITFSYYVDKCLYDYGAKPMKSNIAQCSDISSSESDSEDCDIFDKNLQNKFFKISCSSVSGLSGLSDFDLNDSFDSDSLEMCDRNSSPVHQCLEESLLKNLSNSLSQNNNTQTYSTFFDGFVNPCFEDDDDIVIDNTFLRNVNEEWERNMQNISCEPREPRKVSFRPMPNLVTVQTFEPDDDDYSFGLHLLNQVRFRNRIEEFEEVMKPFLSTKHRASIYKNYFSND